jgi:hypothetical protein
MYSATAQAEFCRAAALRLGHHQYNRGAGFLCAGLATTGNTVRVHNLALLYSQRVTTNLKLFTRSSDRC